MLVAPAEPSDAELVGSVGHLLDALAEPSDAELVASVRQLLDRRADLWYVPLLSRGSGWCSGGHGTLLLEVGLRLMVPA